MDIIRRNQYWLTCLLTGMLALPTMLHAADSISLNKREKQLIAQGEIIVREIDAAGKKGRTFEAIGLIKASRNNVVQVLKDYKKYPEFMPNVSGIEIVEQRGNDTVVNYTLTLPLKKIKKYRLKISVQEPERQFSSIEWQMQKWPELKTAETIKDTTGYWRIEEQDADNSLVLYHVYTDPGPVPFGLGWIVDVLSKNSVPEVLLQTKYRTEEMTQRNALNPEPEQKK